VLELGSGNGKTLSAMLRQGWDVTAIDFSARAVALSRMHTGALQQGDACVADARSLPFASGRFDAVIAVHVLSHLSKNDRIGAAAEAVRVLRSEGLLYFSGFSTGDFRSGKGSAVEPGTVMKGSGICTHYFTEPEVMDLFSPLTPAAITTERWYMRVRGQDLPRAEIQATFLK
jgi:SAM-dependent methyltransferase